MLIVPVYIQTKPNLVQLLPISINTILITLTFFTECGLLFAFIFCLLCFSQRFRSVAVNM